MPSQPASPHSRVGEGMDLPSCPGCWFELCSATRGLTVHLAPFTANGTSYALPGSDPDTACSAAVESVELEESATGLGHCATRACRGRRVATSVSFRGSATGRPGRVAGPVESSRGCRAAPRVARHQRNGAAPARQLTWSRGRPIGSPSCSRRVRSRLWLIPTGKSHRLNACTWRRRPSSRRFSS